MSKDDRNRAEARFNKNARTADDARSGKAERNAAAKAVTDNMAKLKALRLAHEAANPTPVVTKPARARSGTSASKASGKKPAPALGEWLAGQQSGGRRT